MQRSLALLRIASAMIAVAFAFPAPAKAAKLKMICENPRREYVLTFDEAANTVFADETRYRVLAVERTKSWLLVTGLTVNDGPTFRAHFRPYKKIEFFSDNQLTQTDGCR